MFCPDYYCFYFGGAAPGALSPDFGRLQSFPTTFPISCLLLHLLSATIAVYEDMSPCFAEGNSVNSAMKASIRVVTFLGPFPLSKFNDRWVIVAINRLTIYAVTAALPTGSSAEIVTFFVHNILLSTEHHVFCSVTAVVNFRHDCCRIDSVPALLLTSRCRAAHPQTNGLTEWFNHTLGTCSPFAFRPTTTGTSAIPGFCL